MKKIKIVPNKHQVIRFDAGIYDPNKPEAEGQGLIMNGDID